MLLLSFFFFSSLDVVEKRIRAFTIVEELHLKHEYIFEVCEQSKIRDRSVLL